MELNVSLSDVIRRDLGEPARRGRRPFWHCPLHDDHNPSFVLMPDGRRWKCFGCDRSGDVIDYVMQRHSLPFKEAVGFLSEGIAGFSRPGRAVFSHKMERREATPAQVALSRHAPGIIQDCVDRLHSPQGVTAFQWLKERGLRPETIRLGQIGYNPVDRVVAGIFLKRGITVPWVSGDRITGIKIRRPAADPKYIWVKGRTRSGLYLGDHVLAGRPTVLTEGEFDALLGHQELGAHVNVATLGSASDSPDSRSLEQLLGSPLIFLCYDADPAGRRGEDRWRRVTRRVRQLCLPPGMDLTGLFRSTGDLRGWLAAQLRRVGVYTTLHPTLEVKPLHTNEISVR